MLFSILPMFCAVLTGCLPVHRRVCKIVLHVLFKLTHQSVRPYASDLGALPGSDNCHQDQLSSASFFSMVKLP